MKYLATLITVILTVSLMSIVYLVGEPPTEKKDVAMVINGKIISEQGLLEQEIKTGYHDNEKADLVNSVITRELLIQEAQRQKIDKEPEFRNALKEFYEQSLIKTLMDRQDSQFNLTVTEEEVDKYLSLFGKTVTFTKIPVDSDGTAVKGTEENDSYTSSFDDLAQQMQLIIAELEVGEAKTIFDTGTSLYIVRLNKVEQGNNKGAEISLTRGMVKEALTEYKREMAVNSWIEELRKKATITINQD